MGYLGAYARLNPEAEPIILTLFQVVYLARVEHLHLSVPYRHGDVGIA